MLPITLGLNHHILISESPDRPNIFLDRKRKDVSDSVVDRYEKIYVPLCDELFSSPTEFPVTLLYMPLERAADAASYCNDLSPNSTLEDSPFAVICSTQSKTVVKHVIGDLKNQNPHIRLIMCTSAVGMGFDAPTIDRVIHARPPRNMNDYFQEIGRAGRCGQAATATLYFSPSDISANLPDLQQDIVDYCRTDTCLRSTILQTYGFEKGSMSPNGCKCCVICQHECDCLSCV